VPHQTIRMTLGEALRAAFEKRLAQGWLHLPQATELRLDTPCLLLIEDRDAEPGDADGFAASLGFPVAGLDTAGIEDTGDWARNSADLPSDELLLKSFVFYLESDAFLPLQQDHRD